jgi:hypothetical protein
VLSLLIEKELARRDSPFARRGVDPNSRLV